MSNACGVALFCCERRARVIGCLRSSGGSSRRHVLIIRHLSERRLSRSSRSIGRRRHVVRLLHGGLLGVVLGRLERVRVAAIGGDGLLRVRACRHGSAAEATTTAMQRARVSEDRKVSKSHHSRAIAGRWAAVCLTIRTEPKRNVQVLTIGAQNRGILAVGIGMH